MRWKARPEGATWGEFGTDDQVGRMRLLTPERRLEAVREVREGLAFTLSLPLDYPGGQVLSENRRPPQLLAGQRPDGSDNYNFPLSNVDPSYLDVITDDAVLLYTQYSTQWDALAHYGSEFDVDGDGAAELVYYSGYRAGEHILGRDDGGPLAAALGIDKLAGAGVQGRGSLVDLKTIAGEDRVAFGYEALMAAMESQNVEIKAGDFLCLYTGFADMVLEMNQEPDGRRLRGSCAVLDGSDKKLLEWITESQIVAICADNFAVEGVPRSPVDGRRALLPLHEHCLLKIGVHLAELWYFGELAAWMKARRRAHFLLTAPPLMLPGAAGSPVTPIATV